jgi:hypothetical protein
MNLVESEKLKRSRKGGRLTSLAGARHTLTSAKSLELTGGYKEPSAEHDANCGSLTPQFSDRRTYSVTITPGSATFPPTSTKYLKDTV